MLRKAEVHEEYVPGRGPMLWGVDPAGMGQNEFTLSGIQLDLQTYHHAEVVRGAFQGEDAFEQVIATMAPYMPNGMSWWINIDRLGPGERPAIELKRWAAQWGVPVMAFAAQSKSTNSLIFKDLKSQMYCFFRDLLITGAITGITDRKTIQQLLSIRYQFAGAGQTQIEGKEKMEKRGVESPDRAEALALVQFQPFMEFLRIIYDSSGFHCNKFQADSWYIQFRKQCQDAPGVLKSRRKSWARAADGPAD